MNLEDLNPQKDAGFIIGRVLDLGNLKEWRAINDLYALDKITKTIENKVKDYL